MYACMHVCMYACMHVCMYACMHVCLYMGMPLRMYACAHVGLYACMSVRMYACMPTCVHVCLYACTETAATIANYIAITRVFVNCFWLKPWIRLLPQPFARDLRRGAPFVEARRLCFSAAR